MVQNFIKDNYLFFLQEGKMIVHVYSGDAFENELSLVEFKREYDSLKVKFNEARNLKIWDTLSENKK